MRVDRFIASLVIIVSVAVFAVVLAHALWYAPEGAATPAQIAEYAQTSSAPAGPGQKPVRLSIPSIGVNARVQYVGISAHGTIAVPSNFTDVAWYKLGAAPGQIGTAIIDGHVDNALSLPGVFKHLSTVAPGDEIDVETASGTTLRFAVYDTENYPYQSVPMAQILASKGDPELALITCDGTWIQGVREYDHRLVVYARLQ